MSYKPVCDVCKNPIEPGAVMLSVDVVKSRVEKPAPLVRRRRRRERVDREERAYEVCFSIPTAPLAEGRFDLCGDCAMRAQSIPIVEMVEWEVDDLEEESGGAKGAIAD